MPISLFETLAGIVPAPASSEYTPAPTGLPGPEDWTRRRVSTRLQAPFQRRQSDRADVS